MICREIHALEHKKQTKQILTTGINKIVTLNLTVDTTILHPRSSGKSKTCSNH